MLINLIHLFFNIFQGLNFRAGFQPNILKFHLKEYRGWKALSKKFHNFLRLLHFEITINFRMPCVFCDFFGWPTATFWEFFYCKRSLKFMIFFCDWLASIALFSDCQVQGWFCSESLRYSVLKIIKIQLSFWKFGRKRHNGKILRILTKYWQMVTRKIHFVAMNSMKNTNFMKRSRISSVSGEKMWKVLWNNSTFVKGLW